MAEQNISIIIPCFNAEKWLAQAIESALTQTWSSVEVIVVDDGSTDASPRVAESFGARVVFVRQSNRGPCAARNHGLRVASGPLVQFMDADDLLHRRRLEILMDAWQLQPDAQFAAGGYHSFNTGEVEDNEIIREELPTRQPRILYDAFSVKYLPWAGLFRKSFIESLGPWNETLSRWVDLEFHARIAAYVRTPFPFINLPIYCYRQHDGPRISGQNRVYTNLDAAFCALSAAEAHFKAGGEIDDARKSYFFPLYVHLARGYAKAGERQKFLLMLRRASFLSERPDFRYKAQAAEMFARLFGIRAVSNVLERVLPPI